MNVPTQPEQPTQPEPAPAPSSTGAVALRRDKNELVPARSTPAPAAPALNVWTLLKALRRRWLPAAIVGVVCAGLVSTGIWSMLPPPRHTVRSLLHVSHYRFQPIPLDDGYSFNMFQQSQVTLAKSRFVFSTALKDAKVKNLSVVQEQIDPIQWLEKAVQVEFSSAETMQVILRGTETEELRILVNAITDAYLTEIAQKERNKQEVHLKEMRGVFKTFDDRVTSKKAALRTALETAQADSTKLIALRQEMVLRELADLKSERTATMAKLRVAQLDLDMLLAPPLSWEEMAVRLYGPWPGPAVPLVLAKFLKDAGKAQEARSAPRGRIDELIGQDFHFKNLVREEKDLQDFIEAIEYVSPPEGAKGALETRMRDLLKLRKKKDARRAEILPKVLERLRWEMRQHAVNDLGKAHAQVYYLKELVRVFDDEIKRLNNEAVSLNTTSLDVGTLKQEVERWEGRWHGLLGRIEALEANPISDRVNLLEQAVVYGPEAKKSQYLMVGAGGLGAFALVVFAFAWLEFRAQRLNAPDQLTQQVGMQLVGTLPHHAYLLRSRKASRGRYGNILSDSVDAVRTTLLFMSRMEGVRSVLVTSAVAGEGKTSSATHLAASLARAGRRTLLVDCDIRNPVAHRVFKVEQAPGISEVLRGEVALSAVIVATELEGLSVLPAGNGDALALQALALDTTAVLFQELKAKFDFVVVDSSPVLPVPDALLIAQQVDAVVFSVLRDVSTLPKIQAAYRRLGSIGVRILGAIFNGSKDEAYAGYSHSFTSDAAGNPQ